MFYVMMFGRSVTLFILTYGHRYLYKVHCILYGRTTIEMEWGLLQLRLFISQFQDMCDFANVHSCSKVMGFFLRWQNMVFIFKVQTWNFVCGIRRSFAFTMENILSVWYNATLGWTSKFGKVWKTRCQNAATRANIWRCFLVSWDDKYLWVMVSNNRHELYFCSKLLCFSSIHCFFCQIRYLNIRHERTLTSSPLMLKCSERCRETQEREPAHTGWCLVIQPQKFPRYFEIGS